MKFTLKLSHVRFCGYYGYLLNGGAPCVDTSVYPIENVVFYKWNKDTKTPEVVWEFIPSNPNDVTLFNFDGKDDTKFIYHRKETSIKPKEIFSYNLSTNFLWINAEAVEFKGPTLSKKSYVTQKNPETCNKVNYELATIGKWNGGEVSKVISTDYLAFLNIKYDMEEKLKRMRWEGGDPLIVTTKAIKLLQDFRTEAIQNLQFWSDSETTPQMLLEYVTKNKGGDK